MHHPGPSVHIMWIMCEVCWNQRAQHQNPGIPRFVSVRLGSCRFAKSDRNLRTVRVGSVRRRFGSMRFQWTVRFTTFRVLCWPVILSNIVCRCFKYHLGHKASYFQRHGKHTNGSVQSYIRWLGSNTVLRQSCSHHRILELLFTPRETHKRFCSKLYPLTWK